MINSIEHVDSSRAAELEHFLWLFGFRDVCSPDFMFLGQTLKSAVVSTLNLLYEAKFLEIKKDEMKVPLTL